MKNTLYLMCGIPASGKSTFSESFARENNYVRLSSDELRGIVGQNQEDQTVNGKVFHILEATTEHLLAQGQTVVIDATNYCVKNRKSFIAIARKLGVRVAAYVFKISKELAIERNTKRARSVPEFVIEKMWNGFQEPLIGEVDEVIFVK